MNRGALGTSSSSIPSAEWRSVAKPWRNALQCGGGAPYTLVVLYYVASGHLKYGNAELKSPVQGVMGAFLGRCEAQAPWIKYPV